MIIWICSYPRSGNTLTRQILKQCFGADSYSIYPPNSAGLAEGRYTPPGHAEFTGSPEELVAAARKAPAPWFVKTHQCENPADADRVIYVIRDGRAAMASYQRFQRDFNGLDFPTEQFALGAEPLESWTDHVRWAFDRPKKLTLTLRFEELLGLDDALLKRLSEFTGLPVTGTFDRQTFERLRKAEPNFYSEGSNAPGIEAVEKACPALFWLVNGETMRSLDYTDRARHWSIYLVEEAVQELGRCVNRLGHEVRTLKGANSA